VIVIEKVILAYGPHVGADSLARRAVKLLQRDPFPLRGGLDHLSIDGMFVPIVRDVEPDGRARSVTVQHIVDPALRIDDAGNLDHHEVQFLAQVVFDIALHVEDGSLRFPGGEERVVIIGQFPFKFGVVADAGPSQVSFLVENNGAHERLSLGRLTAQAAPLGS
jgi:hypothetical protein